MNLYPTILTSDIAEVEKQINWCINSNSISTIQIDIIDGYFADNVTISPLDLTHLNFGDLTIDFHLMVEEPMDFVHEIVGIKEYLPIRSVIAQVERMSYQDEYVREVRNNDWKVGLSLDLFTPVSAIDKDSWRDLDIVQLMTVEAGFQAQQFNASALEKIPRLKELAEKELEVFVDGGVEETHVPLLAKAGVAGAGVGSALWQAPDPQVAIEEFARFMQTEDSNEN